LDDFPKFRIIDVDLSKGVVTKRALPEGTEQITGITDLYFDLGPKVGMPGRECFGKVVPGLAFR